MTKTQNAQMWRLLIDYERERRAPFIDGKSPSLTVYNLQLWKSSTFRDIRKDVTSIVHFGLSLLLIIKLKASLTLRIY